MKTMWRFLILLGFTISQARSECPDAWVTFQGSCYLFAHDAKTFTEAEIQECFFPLRDSDQFLHLIQSNTVYVLNGGDSSVIPLSPLQFYFGPDRGLLAHSYWIGLSDSDIEGIWKWKDDGAVMTYNDFNPGQPDNENIENCVALWAAHDFRWNDIKCDAQCMPICEKKSVIHAPQDLVG